MKKTYSTPIVSASEVTRETMFQAGKGGNIESPPLTSKTQVAFGL